MRILRTLIASGAGLAALAAAAPASAQYSRYGYNPYQGQYNPYQGQYGNGGYGMNTNAAAQQCAAAVQNRLYNRSGIGGILGIALGGNTTGRVVAVTSTNPTRNGMRVRGLASSGRIAYNNYGPYGVGAYGAVGYGANQAADLSFRCDVDYRGYVRNVDINRRY